MKYTLLIISILFLASCSEQPLTLDEKANQMAKDIMVCSSHWFWYAVIQWSYDVSCIPINWTKPIIK